MSDQNEEPQPSGAASPPTEIAETPETVPEASTSTSVTGSAGQTRGQTEDPDAITEFPSTNTPPDESSKSRGAIPRDKRTIQEHQTKRPRSKSPGSSIFSQSLSCFALRTSSACSGRSSNAANVSDSSSHTPTSNAAKACLLALGGLCGKTKKKSVPMTRVQNQESSSKEDREPPMLPPLTLPPTTLPPLTLPPLTLPPLTLPPLTLPPLTLPPPTLPPTLPPLTLPTLPTLPPPTLPTSLPPLTRPSLTLPPSTLPTSLPSLTLPPSTLPTSLPPLTLPPLTLPPPTLPLPTLPPTLPSIPPTTSRLDFDPYDVRSYPPVFVPETYSLTNPEHWPLNRRGRKK